MMQCVIAVIIKKIDENYRLKYSNDKIDNDINNNNDNDYDDDFLLKDIVRYTIGGWIMDA